MNSWGVIYQYDPDGPTGTIALIQPAPAEATPTPKVRRSHAVVLSLRQIVGLMVIAFGLGGIAGPLIPTVRLESQFMASQSRAYVNSAINPIKPLPASAPVVFDPLIAPDGSIIKPVNTDFSIIVPKIGINAPVIPNVDPANPGRYKDALLEGVAQASTSFTPDVDGTMYLFSHSTNYDWFVKDLNAVFYLLKDLKSGDLVVVYYKGRQYTYRIKETKVVKPTDTSYLVPLVGKKSLILQTCWPPGSTTERLLLFADFVQEQGNQI